MTTAVGHNGLEALVSLSGVDLTTLRQRFFDKTSPEPNTGCLLWIGAISENGYGRIRVYASGKPLLPVAHRIAWLLDRGDIPTGMVLDHTCRNRACVNPAHLRVVTHRENHLAGLWGALHTHCPSGHDIRPVDSRYANGRCIECQRHHAREWKRRSRADVGHLVGAVVAKRLLEAA